MIFGASAANSIPTIGYAIHASSGGRASVPVAPANYIYSHFEHISGVPAPDGGRGIAINRLKILDTLIDQLIQLKKDPQPNYISGDFITDDQIDALILQYEKQLQAAKATPNIKPYHPNPSVPMGAIVNFLA